MAAAVQRQRQRQHLQRRQQQRRRAAAVPVTTRGPATWDAVRAGVCAACGGPAYPLKPRATPTPPHGPPAAAREPYRPKEEETAYANQLATLPLHLFKRVMYFV